MKKQNIALWIVIVVIDLVVGLTWGDINRWCSFALLIVVLICSLYNVISWKKQNRKE